ncbi:unnamed protein product [Mytilus edulis]|uniref:Reverse transcriptase domain-containing protein n=1 Tax=Mytilus edulis TaxID=6550 RepID=A0A8S3TE00_MYTED|nr:unnamed protein product [Mytilus edulis]
MRSARKEWTNQCHCHDSNCNAFVTYKNSKRLFRAALRKAFDEFESSTARRLEKEIDIDQKHAWTILNRRKKKSSDACRLRKKAFSTLILTIYAIFAWYSPGSSLSAKLYLIFINDLINELESSKEGAFFHDLNASSPVQADDIAIIATNCVSTQRMVTICENYSNMWGFTFSPAKSKLLQFGKRRTSTPTYLYQEPINYVTSARHIGIQLDTSLKTMDRTLKACRTLCSTTASVIRLGIHPAIVNPIVCAKIIRQLCYPKALYGCELWGKLTCTEILMIERTHHYICKFIQGLPRRTRRTCVCHC